MRSTRGQIDFPHSLDKNTVARAKNTPQLKFNDAENYTEYNSILIVQIENSLY